MNKLKTNLFKTISTVIGINLLSISALTIGGCHDNKNNKPPQRNWLFVNNWDFDNYDKLKIFINKTALFNKDCVLKMFKHFSDYPLFKKGGDEIPDPWVYFNFKTSLVLLWIAISL